MRRGVAARVAVAVLLAVAPLAPLVYAGVDDGDTAAGSTAGPGATLDDHTNGLVGGTPPATAAPESATAGTDREVLVVVEMEQGATLGAEHALDVERTYTRQGARHLQGHLPLSAVRSLSKDPGVGAVRIESDGVGQPEQVAAGVETIGATALHRAGLTGSNVTVGIIDAGFRVGDPEIAANVGAYRVFDAERTDGRHGTAVASVVVDTAPDARLHLASVGRATTPAEYRRAVGWLERSGADVIVDAGSYFGGPGTGNGTLARIAANASEDTLFVTSAGNYARRHWTGTHNASARPKWVRFGSEVPGNVLNGGDPLSGTVRVSLRWDGWPETSQNYDLYLFRKQFRRDELVAKSTGDRAAGTPTEFIEATVPRGRYYVAVHPENVTGTHRLELFTSHRLTHHNASGSLASPATAPGVLVVGAHDGDGVAAFSSRGPVGNRTGVDLVAPDSVAVSGFDRGAGTSYAAPYAAGTAALLVAEHPSLTPAGLRTVLAESATDVGPAGVDPAAGHGLLDARDASARAVAAAQQRATNATETGLESAADFRRLVGGMEHANVGAAGATGTTENSGEAGDAG